VSGHVFRHAVKLTLLERLQTLDFCALPILTTRVPTHLRRVDDTLLRGAVRANDQRPTSND
jgi:hypothetical protein